MEFTSADVVTELSRRAVAKKATPKYLDGTFPAQDAFILDHAKLKVALCTRRAGKSYGCGKYLFKECLENPGVKTLFIAKTRSSAAGIIWDDVLKPLNKLLKADVDFKLSDLKVIFPNGSSISLLGADANETERDKVLGQKFKLVVIDEAEAYQHVDLRKLIYVTLYPAMLDLEGTICMIGMPNDVTYGLYFDVTTKNGLDETEKYGLKQWSLHKWSTRDNPFMKDKFETEIAKEKAANPDVENTSSFRQSWKGEWAVSDTSLVYQFDSKKNTFLGNLPVYPAGQWNYVMGMDTGWTDATAMSVGAYHDHDFRLYVLTTFKQSEMPFDDVVRKMKTLFQQYPIDTIVIDPANKHVVESLKARTGLPIKSADKSEKMAHIKIMNSDMSLGRILYGPDTQSVQEEYKKLVKGEDGKEDPRCKNDNCDSTLYMWRYCYQFLSQAPQIQPKYGTKEWFEAEDEQGMINATKEHDTFINPYGSAEDPFYSEPPSDYYYGSEDQ